MEQTPAQAIGHRGDAFLEKHTNLGEAPLSKFIQRYHIGMGIRRLEGTLICNSFPGSDLTFQSQEFLTEPFIYRSDDGQESKRLFIRTSKNVKGGIHIRFSEVDDHNQVMNTIMIDSYNPSHERYAVAIGDLGSLNHDDYPENADYQSLEKVNAKDLRKILTYIELANKTIGGNKSDEATQKGDQLRRQLQHEQNVKEVEKLRPELVKQAEQLRDRLIEANQIELYSMGLMRLKDLPAFPHTIKDRSAEGIIRDYSQERDWHCGYFVDLVTQQVDDSGEALIKLEQVIGSGGGVKPNLILDENGYNIEYQWEDNDSVGQWFGVSTDKKVMILGDFGWHNEWVDWTFNAVRIRFDNQAISFWNNDNELWEPITDPGIMRGIDKMIRALDQSDTLDLEDPRYTVYKQERKKYKEQKE